MLTKSIFYYFFTYNQKVHHKYKWNSFLDISEVNRQYHIALARPYVTFARHIAIYRMHSGGSDQMKNMSAYISNLILISCCHVIMYFCLSTIYLIWFDLPQPPPHLVLELCIGFGLSVVVRPVKHHYHHQYLASQAPLPLPHIPIYMTILPSPYLHPTSWVLMYYVLQSNIIPIPYMTNDHWPWGNFMTEACTILTSNGLSMSYIAALSLSITTGVKT